MCEQDITLEQALKEYAEYFGKDYCYYVGHTKTNAGIIADIQKCIRTGREQQQPRYDQNIDY